MNGEASIRRCLGRLLVAAVVLAPVLASCTGDSADRYPRSTVTLPPATTTSTTTVAPSTTVATTTEQGEVIVSPADDLAALVDASQPGTTFLLTPGTHRTVRYRRP